MFGDYLFNTITMQLYTQKSLSSPNNVNLHSHNVYNNEYVVALFTFCWHQFFFIFLMALTFVDSKIQNLYTCTLHEKWNQ